MRETLAIVGTGIAALAAAHRLKDSHELTLFEKNDYIGGHSNTVEVEEDGRRVSFDTGFMVFNYQTYPLLTELFAELKVPVKKTDMSFGVSIYPAGLAYCGSSFNQIFAQRKNLVSPAFWRMLRDIARFNREAYQLLLAGKLTNLTLEQLVAQQGYGREFLNDYLIPMSAAVWSTPPAQILAFPAATLVRFFHNHGFLGMNTQHQWYTVDGGAREYVHRLVAPFADRIRLRTPVRRITRSVDGVLLEYTDPDGTPQARRFGKVLVAAHGDEALRLLGDPAPEETEALGAFAFQPNLAYIHSDPSIMPRERRAWASWNYRIDRTGGEVTAGVHYWMNSLQGVSDKRDYFVSLIPQGNPAPPLNVGLIHKVIAYDHPLFSQAAVAAQTAVKSLPDLLPHLRTYFAGAYLGYGFHEDGIRAGVQAAAAIARQWAY